MDGSPHPRMHVHRQDDAIGQWTVAWLEPTAALRPFVSTLWYGEGRTAYQRDRILPAGVSHLLINLGPTQYRIDAGPPERRVAFDDIWYSGLHQGPIDTEAPHGNALLGVAFHPSGARPWMAMDADATVDQVLPLADLIGATASHLRQRLLETNDLAARFALVEAWLLSKLDPRRLPHPLVCWSMAQIEASGGQVVVESLAREAGVTRMTLSRLFRQQIGLTPKVLARLSRFRAATQMLAGVERVPWVELAAHCGYFDQSHLVRDFKAFSGMAPGEFVRHARADGSSLVIR